MQNSTVDILQNMEGRGKYVLAYDVSVQHQSLQEIENMCVDFIESGPYENDGQVIQRVKKIHEVALRASLIGLLNYHKPAVFCTMENEVTAFDDKPYEVPSCPMCKNPAYESDRCVFCGQPFISGYQGDNAQKGTV